MRKNYETVKLDFEYFEDQDVVLASPPTGENNDGTIVDDYEDVL